MAKIATAFLALGITGMCAAQTATTNDNAVKYFRLTFVLSYPENTHPSQSFALDVPVADGHPGTAILNTASGSSADGESFAQERLQCTNIHRSATGIAGQVSFAMSTPPSQLPGLSEPLHHQMNFEQQIDVELGKATLITKPMHRIPLKKGDEVYANALPEAPQITVTASEI